MYDILLIFADFCRNSPWFWLIFCYPDPFYWSGSGSGWPKWNGSKRIRIRNTAFSTTINVSSQGCWRNVLAGGEAAPGGVHPPRQLPLRGPVPAAEAPAPGDRDPGTREGHQRPWLQGRQGWKKNRLRKCLFVHIFVYSFNFAPLNNLI